MTIELVGLAYDRHFADTVWTELTVREAYEVILRDEFRRRVDFRSMLYHKGHLELLGELEYFLKSGGENRTMVELLAARFLAGIESFPNPSGEFAFDFQLIRHCASLAMVDDFLVADPFLRLLLEKTGFLGGGAAWSLIEARDFDGISTALTEVRMKDILDASENLNLDSRPVSFENLVRNYIEFLSYARNNGLTPFFYNNQSDFKRWGDLVERKNRRNEIIVDLSLYRRAPTRRRPTPGPVRPPQTKDLSERMKHRRECDALVGGLKDSDPLIRQKSAESLGRLAEPETLAHLVDSLGDSESEVRQEIVRAIGELPNGSGTPELLKVLKDDDVQSVRLIAAYVLQMRGERAAIPLLVDLMASGHPRFPTILAHHPGLKSDRSAIKRVKELAMHEDPVVRREAAYVLGRLPKRLGTEKVLSRMLVGDADDEAKGNALYSLFEVSADAAKPAAEKMATSDAEICAQAGTVVRRWCSAGT